MAPSRLADQLADTLLSEAKLLAELSATMQRQRDAVAVDDLDAIDDSVFCTHRVLATLGEARRRRRWLAQLLGESDDLSLSALAHFFNGNPPACVHTAAAHLADAARVLQRDVNVNRRVLRRAIEASDAYVRTLCGISGPESAAYSDAPGRAGEGSPGGHIVDRRA